MAQAQRADRRCQTPRRGRRNRRLSVAVAGVCVWLSACTPAAPPNGAGPWLRVAIDGSGDPDAAVGGDQAAHPFADGGLDLDAGGVPSDTSSAGEVGGDATGKEISGLADVAKDAAADAGKDAGATDAVNKDAVNKDAVTQDATAADTVAQDGAAADSAGPDVVGKDTLVADTAVDSAGPDSAGPDSVGPDSAGADGGGGQGSTCCSAQPTAGCSDPAIQGCVCAKDATCCSGAWDDVCVAEVASFGCGSCSTGGSGGGGATDPNADVCKAWKSARADLSEGAWTGAAAGCSPGDIGANGRANTLKLINLYRKLTGLPAVQMTDQWNSALQHCALMMHANKALSHAPPLTWKCYAAGGAEQAKLSNIATAPAVQAVDLYVVDPGNDKTLGHRRWLLSNSLGPIGVGSTSAYSCLHVIAGSGKAGKAWTAWPPPGDVPYQAFHVFSWTHLDATGWSIQSDAINLGKAKVAVTSGGQALAVVTQPLLANYGSAYAISFKPQGWVAQPGKTYHVEVQGINPPIVYDVHVLNCL